VILHYFHSQERLQLLKNEGHILCHTKVTPEETGVRENLTITHTHRQRRMKHDFTYNDG
jgi:hypothetical protein